MRLTKSAKIWSLFFIVTLVALTTVTSLSVGATEPTDVNSLLQQANALYSQRDNPAKALEAADLYRKAIELAPDNEQAMIGLVQSPVLGPGLSAE